MLEKGNKCFSSSNLYDGVRASSESCRSEPESIPLYERDADKIYSLVIEKIKEIKKSKYIPQHCIFCGMDEEGAYLLRVKRKGDEEWICTNCLAALKDGME